ncbi:hypothetical protein D3C75_571940 [compost metagenome]
MVLQAAGLRQGGDLHDGQRVAVGVAVVAEVARLQQQRRIFVGGHTVVGRAGWRVEQGEDGRWGPDRAIGKTYLVDLCHPTEEVVKDGDAVAGIQGQHQVIVDPADAHLGGQYGSVKQDGVEIPQGGAAVVHGVHAIPENIAVHIIAAVTRQGVVTEAAEQLVIASTAADAIVPKTPIYQIITVVTEQRVVTIPAVQIVIARETIELVIAG